MDAFKEKLIKIISHFFPQSPKSPPPIPRSYYRKPKSLLSCWTDIIPSISFGGSKKSNHQSISVRRNYENFGEDDGDLIYKYVNLSPNSKDLLKGKSNDEDQVSRKRNSSSEEVNVQSFPNTPKKLQFNFTDHSAFISPDLNDFFDSSLPDIVRGCQGVLLYSTLKHGTSLRTLLHNSAKLSGPSLLVVRDMQGAVFGGLLECPLKPTKKPKYQGTNQTFVFTTTYGQPRLFRPTGANRFYYLCSNDLLALGGGGSFALYLNEDLLTGSSGRSDTFGNLCLAHSPEFELKNVELWGFTYCFPYLKQQ
ncbi:hypothetical protein VNO77_14341 [Canavalia gladiata]|uniref:TLDc domain-containing protein n=1 Tax=Canavalia gladiata TaxID=3824 RepID=A0AAN9LZB5_CANGL